MSDIIKLRKYLFNIIRIIWIFTAIYSFFALLFADSHSITSPEAKYLGTILLLTFPLGTIIGFLSSYIFLHVFQIDSIDSGVFFVIILLLTITAGYYQWFIFIPKILAKDEQARLKELEEMKIKKDNQE